MTKKEQLMEQYEEIVFSILMNEIAEEEGAKLEKLNQELLKNPSAAVPEELDQRCEKTIRKAFAKQNAQSAGRVLFRGFRAASVVLVILAVMFITAFASSERVRVTTLNMLIEVSDVATKLTFSETKAENKTTHSFEENSFLRIRDYVIEVDLSGFEIEKETYDEFGFEVRLKETAGDKQIIISADPAAFLDLSIDTENAERAEILDMDGIKGFYVQKGTRKTFVWNNTQSGDVISVICMNTTFDYLLSFVKNFVYLPVSK